MHSSPESQGELQHSSISVSQSVPEYPALHSHPYSWSEVWTHRFVPGAAQRVLVAAEHRSGMNRSHDMPVVRPGQSHAQLCSLRSR